MTGCSESLSTCFLLPLFQFLSLSSPCGDGAKTLGAVCCADGRERPQGVTFGNEGPKSGVAPAQLRVLAPSFFFAVSFPSLWLSSASPVFRVTPKQNGLLNTFLRAPFTLIRRPWPENPAASEPNRPRSTPSGSVSSTETRLGVPARQCVRPSSL